MASPSPASAASSTAALTAPGMFFTTVVRKTEQYCGTLSQPSRSTQITAYSPDSAAAAAVPRPVPPATGMITSAP